jgi:hypothetical protein
MTTLELLAVGVGVAVLLALAALVGVVLVWRRTRRAVGYAHAHRRIPAEPVHEERALNLGPPRATGERRREDRGPEARHRAPDDARATRAEADDPAWRVEDGTPTAEHPAPRPLPPVGDHAPTVEARLLPPGRIGPRQ